jgi:Glycosyltransferase
MNNLEKRKLRALFIASDKFPPFRVDVSVLFGEEMISRGHTIDWLLQSFKPCHSSYEATWQGGQVWVGATDTGTSKLARTRKHLLAIVNDFRMFRLLRYTQYDLIQVKDKYISALLAIIAARLYRVKLVYWISFPAPEASLYMAKSGLGRYPMFYLFRGLVLRWLLYHVIIPSADHVFVQSEQMKKDIAALGVPPEKLTPVPMGLSLRMFPHEIPRQMSDTCKPHETVVYLGTLNRNRRLDFLLSVLTKVLRECPNTTLYFVGDGDEPADRQILEEECARLGIQDAVIFTGFIPREEALRYVARADVCVSPFYPTPILNSTSPTKLIEYMALGKAVVANDHPEQRLVIEESSGGICVPYDGQAFADAIIYLLQNPHHARQMGDCGHRYVVEHRNYEKISEVVELQYLKICQRTNPIKISTS